MVSRLRGYREPAACPDRVYASGVVPPHPMWKKFLDFLRRIGILKTTSGSWSGDASKRSLDDINS